MRRCHSFSLQVILCPKFEFETTEYKCFANIELRIAFENAAKTEMSLLSKKY